MSNEYYYKITTFEDGTPIHQVVEKFEDIPDEILNKFALVKRVYPPFVDEPPLVVYYGLLDDDMQPITVERLEKLSAKEVKRLEKRGKFHFDSLDESFACLTYHQKVIE